MRSHAEHGNEKEPVLINLKTRYAAIYGKMNRIINILFVPNGSFYKVKHQYYGHSNRKGHHDAHQ